MKTANKTSKGILTFILLSTITVNCQILTENFDSISLLQTLGWSRVNSSEPIGTSSWGAGGNNSFPAYNGANNSYIAVNHQSTGSNGTISNWLITPTLNLNNGDIISFFSRTHHATWADRLELRISQNGAASVFPNSSSSSVGDFTTLALTINPNLIATEYPTVWTNYTYTVTGLAQPTDCRIAFRYYVTDAGSNGLNSDYIGIDALTVSNALSIIDSNDILIGLTPNPAQNTLHINTQETIKEAAVYDMLGKRVFTTPIANNSIDVSNLTQGMFLLKIGTESDKIIYKKFIKQ